MNHLPQLLQTPVVGVQMVIAVLLVGAALVALLWNLNRRGPAQRCAVLLIPASPLNLIGGAGSPSNAIGVE